VLRIINFVAVSFLGRAVCLRSYFCLLCFETALGFFLLLFLPLLHTCQVPSLTSVPRFGLRRPEKFAHYRCRFYVSLFPILTGNRRWLIRFYTGIHMSTARGLLTDSPTDCKLTMRLCLRFVCCFTSFPEVFYDDGLVRSFFCM
jgi:hypothetical protein